jgi:hypothetical protein
VLAPDDGRRPEAPNDLAVRQLRDRLADLVIEHGPTAPVFVVR